MILKTGKFGNVDNKLNYYEFFKFLLRAQPEAKINTVCYFTALNFQQRDDRLRRHRSYIETLAQVYGIEIIMGEFAHPKGHKPVENLTDVNLASRFVFDACKKSCDVMYLYSSDNDFRPAIRAATAVNKDLQVNVISPASRERNKNFRGKNRIISLTNGLKRAGRGDMILVTKPELHRNSGQVYGIEIIMGEFAHPKGHKPVENLTELAAHLFTIFPNEKPSPQLANAPAAPRQYHEEVNDPDNRINFYIHGNDVQENFAGRKVHWLDYKKLCGALANKIGGTRGEMVYFATPIRGQEEPSRRYRSKLKQKKITTEEGYFAGENGTQEKQTLIKIASKMIVDAHEGACKNICLISNDDNLSAALKYTRLASSNVNVYLFVIVKEKSIRNKKSYNKFSVARLEDQVKEENIIYCTAEELSNYTMSRSVINYIEEEAHEM